MSMLGTAVDTIPAEVPYLSIDPVRAAALRDRIGAASRLKVGLVWGGNPGKPGDRERSIALSALRPLLDVEGVCFFSLQKGEREAELAATDCAAHVVDLAPLLGDMADTAAAIGCLDLVISVDTSVAHLAGALAKPVWMLLPFAPDWRWLLDRTDSPWYPTMRLYRQAALGEWNPVIGAVAEALRDIVAGGTPLPERSPQRSAASASVSKRNTVVFNWQASSFHGWGVYGLNLMMHWGRRADLSVASGFPIVRERLALDPLEMRAIADAIENSAKLRARMDHTQNDVRVAGIVMDALGNNLAGPPNRLVGTPSIGVVFLEFTQFDAQLRERSRRYPLIVAGSTWNRDVLGARGIDQVQTVLQGIDTTRFRLLPRRNLFPGRFVVFSGGKLEWRKGQDLVVQAFRAFARRHREALLLTAWNSPWPEMARSVERNPTVAPVPFDAEGQIDIPAWLAANGIAAEQFINLGAVPNADMPRILSEVDGALFPNRAEGGTNLVAMECMACGVPTILSANTGHLDLVESPNCFLLERQTTIADAKCEGWGESDIDEIVSALEWLYVDPAAARERGRLGAQWMAELSWPKQLDKLEQALHPYLG
jgi:glycosyltransferase involved in cell wall biosynthesis